MTDLVLKHGLSFADLYDRDRLVRLDRAFVAHLAEADVGLHDRLMTARRDPDAIERLDESNLLVDLAPYLGDFIGELFGIEADVRALQARHHELALLYSVKRLFVQRRAAKGLKEAEAAAIDGPELARELDRLMHAAPVAAVAAWERRYAEDSCSPGLREKDGAFKKSVFGVALAGCPLEEKISEMNLVKARGNSLGALAIVTVDNPICAATGHRICGPMPPPATEPMAIEVALVRVRSRQSRRYDVRSKSVSAPIQPELSVPGSTVHGPHRRSAYGRARLGCRRSARSTNPTYFAGLRNVGMPEE